MPGISPQWPATREFKQASSKAQKGKPTCLYNGQMLGQLSIDRSMWIISLENLERRGLCMEPERPVFLKPSSTTNDKLQELWILFGDVNVRRLSSCLLNGNALHGILIIHVAASNSITPYDPGEPGKGSRNAQVKLSSQMRSTQIANGWPQTKDWGEPNSNYISFSELPYALRAMNTLQNFNALANSRKSYMNSHANRRTKRALNVCVSCWSHEALASQVWYIAANGAKHSESLSFSIPTPRAWLLGLRVHPLQEFLEDLGLVGLGVHPWCLRSPGWIPDPNESFHVTKQTKYHNAKALRCTFRVSPLLAVRRKLGSSRPKNSKMPPNQAHQCTPWDGQTVSLTTS